MKISSVSVKDFRSKVETSGLLEEHYQEVCLLKETVALAPNWEMYNLIENSGLLLTLIAEDDAGDPVGYSVSTLYPHLHYKDLYVLHNDVLFVGQRYRKSRTGLRLIRETELLAKERGVNLICWHAKPGTTLASLFDNRPGYMLQDLIYVKEI